MSDGYVWEIRREEEAVDIPYFGHINYEDGKGFVYYPNEYIKAVPYDVPIVGDGNGIVNYLRLWNAEPSKSFPKGKSPFTYETELQKYQGYYILMIQLVRKTTSFKTTIFLFSCWCKEYY